MRIASAGIFLALMSGQAAAGAWPREKGETFVSAGQMFSTGAKALLAPTQSLNSYSSIYAEHGLTERLTLGLDAAYGLGPESRLETGLVFARYPIWSTDSGSRIAADLGIGWRNESSGHSDLRLRAGLAWGKGFDSRWGNGWLGIEASAETLPPSTDTIFKTDFTVGLKPNDRWMIITQVQTGRYPGSGPIVRIAPSLVKAFGDHVNLELGIAASVYGDDSIGLKMATWFRF